MKKIVVMTLLMIGCMSSNHSGKISFDYPADIQNRCIAQREAAKTCINNNGAKVSEKVSLKVVKRNGEALINGFWSWKEPSWGGMWVTGLTQENGNGILMLVGCNPKDGSGVRDETLKHEHGHYYLMSNFNDWGHDPKYAGCFRAWNDPKHQTREMNIDGRKCIVDFIPEEDARSIELVK